MLPSFLKVFIYRRKGYKIGKGVSLGLGSIIVGKDVTLGDRVKTGFMSVIRGKKIVIERYATIGSFSMLDCDNIRIGEDSRINEQVIVGGMKTPESSFDLGKRTIVMEYSFINTTLPVTIGDDSGIGGHCLLFTHGSWLNELEGFPVTFAPITIGKSVWLPWRVFVMPGVTLGNETVVGANSLVSGTFPANCLIAGSPAKIIKENYKRTLSPEEKKIKFGSYLSAFERHLTFNNIRAARKITDAHERFSIQTEGKKVEILVLFEASMSSESLPPGSAIVYNVSGNAASVNTNSVTNMMWIDIGRKQRAGSTPAGEEFAKFLSRYGMRFARND